MADPEYSISHSFSVAAAPEVSVPKVLITDGAPHPPEKWARTVAEDVVRVNNPAGETLRQIITQALTPIFGLVGRWDVETLTREAVGRVLRCVGESPWGTHFVRAEREADLTDILMRHLTMARDTDAQHRIQQGRR